VEVALAAGAIDVASAAADELDAIVEAYSTPALDATRLVARGRVHLAQGDVSGAADELRHAIRAWREVGAPFEVARTRAVLAHVLRALDDDDAADLELQAALTEFERLGARIDAQAAQRDLQAAMERRRGPSQTRMTFMFTDIVGSTKLAEALGDEAWDRLLRWHDDTLRALVTAGGGEIVKSTGDGFFAAFGGAHPAVDCAVSIQRALADHRRTSGFALSVRIGLHTAEASRRGTDYSGVGVHTAARVADLAGPGEILATTETLVEAGIDGTGAREATVKGVTAPVAVATVAWD
jgi:class 3 adenylate cyclase